MMSEKDAAELLTAIKNISIEVWIDGGWGVDALVGRQTRPHNDIDIFVESENSAAIIEMLTTKGYREVKADFTTEDHTVWRCSQEREIDLHVFSFGENSQLHFNGEVFPADILDGKGTIGGIAVRCLTPEAQLAYHQGYVIKDKDVHDVVLLCDTFKLPMPPEYRDEYMKRALSNTEV